MKPSKALRIITARALQTDTIRVRKPRKTGYKKIRGNEQQGLYDRITAYALSCPLCTLSEIALDNGVSVNTVTNALKEAGIRKAEQKIGRSRVPWVKTEQKAVMGVDFTISDEPTFAIIPLQEK